MMRPSSVSAWTASPSSARTVHDHPRESFRAAGRRVVRPRNILRKGEVVHDGDVDEAIGVLRDVLEVAMTPAPPRPRNGLPSASWASRSSTTAARSAGSSDPRRRSAFDSPSSPITQSRTGPRVQRQHSSGSHGLRVEHRPAGDCASDNRRRMTIGFRIDALHLGAGTYHVHANAVASEEGESTASRTGRLSRSRRLSRPSEQPRQTFRSRSTSFRNVEPAQF